MAYRFSNYFQIKEGFLHCEQIRVKDLARDVAACGVSPPSPLFVYSKSQLLANIQAYKKALAALPVPSIINYSMKANANVSLLKVVRGEGCSTTLVSGIELEFARVAGFHPQRMMFNGNGKTRAEIEKAVRAGCLVNVDSQFDCRRIASVCRQLGTKANVLLRINPDIDPKVHPYVSTGLACSKFGVCMGDIDKLTAMMLESSHLHLVGLHCHVGSTVKDVGVFRLCLEVLLDVRRTLLKRGFTDIQYINLGGGLAIDYEKHAGRTFPARLDTDEELKEIQRQIYSEDSDVQAQLNSSFDEYKAEKISRSEFHQRLASQCDIGRNSKPQVPFPTPAELTDAIKPLLAGETGITLIVEPGRSLVGNTAILVSSVLGCKSTGLKRFLITDGSMTEVIRPSLYGSYHHIELIEPVSENEGCHVVDVVGPVCESADILGKDRLLPTAHEGCGLAMFDVGAYCSSMASNYNLRVRPCEVLVDGCAWHLIREPDSLDDLLKPYSSAVCGKGF